MLKTIKTRVRYTVFGIIIGTLGTLSIISMAETDIKAGKYHITNKDMGVVQAESQSKQIAGLFENASKNAQPINVLAKKPQIQK